MLAVNEAKEVKVLLLADDGSPVSGTIAYIVYDEADASFASGTMSAVAGVTGLYTLSFTPDAAGEWTIKFTCATPPRNAIKTYQVGQGVEAEIKTETDKIASHIIALATHDTDIKALLNHATYGLSALNIDLDQILLDIADLDGDIVTLATALGVVALALATHDADIKALLTTIQADLDNPNQYKADVSALALEATLGTHDTDIKALLGTIQTDLDNPNQYKADVSALALEATLGTHDVDIKALLNHATYGLSAIETLVDTLETVLGTVVDVADIAGSVTAKQQAIFENIHAHCGLVVADKSSLTAEETATKTQLERRYQVYIIDDDDIDAGDYDLAICSFILISCSVTDMTKINKLTTLAVPLITCNPQVALTIFRMGDDSGGAGTSWGTTAAQTQINIINITHEITTTQSLGNLTVWDPNGTAGWIRKTDLVVGAVQLSEIAGDNAKVIISVLPYDVNDEDGTSAISIRVFIGGLSDHDNLNAVGEVLFYEVLEWSMHQGMRVEEIEGLGKVNTIINMLGKNKFRSAEDVFDYLVTGTTNAAPFEVIASGVHGSVLERLNAMMEKDTGPAFDPDTDSLEAISEALATHVTALGTHDTDVKALLEHATYGLAALETLVDEVESILKNATYGLSALKTEIDANETKIDTLITNLATHATALGTHDTDMKADFDRHISQIDIWSEGVPVVNIPAGADQDINLPDVIVPALPTGATIWKVFLLFKCAIIKDTSAGDNAIDEAGVIRIKKDGDATFDGNGVDAYVIEDNKWSVDISESTERGGDAFVGKTDLGPSGANKVDGADTYELRLDSVSADGTNLVLVDVCVGLRVLFY